MCKQTKIFENMASESAQSNRNDTHHIAYIGDVISMNTAETRFSGENISSVHAERRALWRFIQRRQRLKDL